MRAGNVSPNAMDPNGQTAFARIARTMIGHARICQYFFHYHRLLWKQRDSVLTNAYCDPAEKIPNLEVLRRREYPSPPRPYYINDPAKLRLIDTLLDWKIV